MKNQLLEKLLDLVKSDSEKSMVEIKNDLIKNIFPSMQLAPDSNSDTLAKDHLIKDIDNFINNPNDFYKNQLF